MAWKVTQILRIFQAFQDQTSIEEVYSFHLPFHSFLSTSLTQFLYHQLLNDCVFEVFLVGREVFAVGAAELLVALNQPSELLAVHGFAAVLAVPGGWK